MEIARHVFDTYFKDTANPLVRHHLDSYADLLSTKIPQFIQGSNPRRLIMGDDRIIEVYIGKRDGKSIRYSPPVDETGSSELPHTCRLENKTYALSIYGEIEIDYTINKEITTRVFENVLIARIPLMLKSSACYLSSMTQEDLYNVGECKFELGGYFIIGGAEKVLLTQERLANNIPYASKRTQINSEEPTGKSLIEKEEKSELEEITKEDNYEYIAGMKSVSEDGTIGPYSHFLVIPPANVKIEDPKILNKVNDYGEFNTKRLAVITLPGFTQPVPLISVFHALGLTSDQDIYDTILCGIPELERIQYDEIFTQLLLSHERFVKQEINKEEDKNIDPDLLLLRRQTQTRSIGGIYVNLYSNLFPHCSPKNDESTISLYRRKAYILGNMVRMAMNVAIGISPKTDRDHLQYKRLVSSGDLLFSEFIRVYNSVSKRMLLELDTRVHYEQQIYADNKLVDLVQEENVQYYWRPYNFLSDIEKSFKGKWAGKIDGVSQELSRYAYVGTVAHLRRVNVDMDKTTKIIESRRIHGSSWGMLCPSDNPDGRPIGLTKSMTLMCRISTASPSNNLLEIIEKNKSFLPIASIHPSTWNVVWTKIFLNSELVGVLEEDTENFHKQMVEKRRNQEIDRYVSLRWNRMENEYVIFTDAGRPCRPVYQEHVDPVKVKKTNNWNNLLNNFIDYIDASETESLRISMEPFSTSYPSEIHGLAILSASASILPNSDFNPGTRNSFSCQQMKQACSWYNTAFNKRFDTIATWLNYAQRPICQTWTTNAVLGKSGCLPYGENPIVALMVYTGYNQEDSVLLNEASLNRGMFNTTYYHSYDVSEETINEAQQTQTEFANIATNPKYKDTVTRKQGYNYDFLDADGIIKVGSVVTDKTVLVGIVSPISNSSEEVVMYKDISYVPKRGQIGIVDAVYRYSGQEQQFSTTYLNKVKIRIVEKRIPVLGDKFSARHGQKGTVGMIVPEQDMPYTANGIRPDMIVNPHAFPTRMTVGQFVEMMATKLGIHLGGIMDSTPFSSSNKVSELKSLLSNSGFHPYGHEIMYNGFSGEMLETEIFMAPTYYLRLKHMVDDKINYRDTGPKKLLTHQPVEGRANDGGLRIGEMERDALISHGISKFLNESLMERSDKTELLFLPEIGKFDANTDSQPVKITTSYATGLSIHEMESMHVSVNLISS